MKRDRDFRLLAKTKTEAEMKTETEAMAGRTGKSGFVDNSYDCKVITKKAA